MAGVPEKTFPMVEPAAQPVAEAVESPRFNIASAVGVGLTQIGEELHTVGWEAYHRSAEAQAQDKETAFQKEVLKLRDQYRNMYLFDAVRAHDAFADASERLRVDIGNTIGTKYGRALYMNSSLRNSRFVQESMDSHYEQQNRAYQEKTYQDGQKDRATLAAAKASDAAYSPEDVEQIVQGAYDAGAKRAAEGGRHGDEVDTFAKAETHKVTDALFSILTNRNNPNRKLAAAELEKFSAKGWVDKNAYKDVLNTLKAGNVADWAKDTFAKFVRTDSTEAHEIDPEGYVQHSALSQFIKARADAGEPLTGAQIDALNAEYDKDQVNYNKQAGEMFNTLRTQIFNNGGKIPEDSKDWQKAVRLYGNVVSTLTDKVTSRDWQAWHRGKISIREASREAYGSVRAYIDTLPQDQIQQTTTEQLDQMLTQAYKPPPGGKPGVVQFPDQEDRAKLFEHLKRLKEGKAGIERQFGSIIEAALEEAYKGNRNLVRTAKNRAYYFVDDTYAESVKQGKPKTVVELREDLVKEFQKKNGVFGTQFLGSREGEGYVRGAARNKIPEFEVGSQDWKKLKSGSKFRLKTDPPDKYRLVP